MMIFACSDGVVITPLSRSARVVVAPTVFEPTGEKVIPLIPRKTIGLVPLFLFSGRAERFKHILEFNEPFLDFPKLPSGDYLQLEDKKENAILYLGRGAAVLSKFIVAMSVMEKSDLGKPVMTKLFFQKALKDFSIIKKKLSETIEKVSDLQMNTEEKEKMDFYVLLAKVYIAQVDFFLSQYKKGSSIEELASIAKAFREIGRDNVSQLPEIIKERKKIHPVKMMKRRFSKNEF